MPLRTESPLKMQLNFWYQNLHVIDKVSGTEKESTPFILFHNLIFE